MVAIKERLFSSNKRSAPPPIILHHNHSTPPQTNQLSLHMKNHHHDTDHDTDHDHDHYNMKTIQKPPTPLKRTSSKSSNKFQNDDTNNMMQQQALVSPPQRKHAAIHYTHQQHNLPKGSTVRQPLRQKIQRSVRIPTTKKVKPNTRKRKSKAATIPQISLESYVLASREANLNDRLVLVPEMELEIKNIQLRLMAMGHDRSIILKRKQLYRKIEALHKKIKWYKSGRAAAHYESQVAPFIARYKQVSASNFSIKSDTSRYKTNTSAHQEVSQNKGVNNDEMSTNNKYRRNIALPGMRPITQMFTVRNDTMNATSGNNTRYDNNIINIVDNLNNSYENSDDSEIITVTNLRKTIIDEYLTLTKGNEVRYENGFIDKCSLCNIPLIENNYASIMMCPKCGVQHNILDATVGAQSYAKRTNIKVFVHRKCIYFESRMSCHQAKETKIVPPEILTKIMDEIYQQGVTNIYMITPDYIFNVLKKLVLKDWYNHCQQIAMKLTGIPIPLLSSITQNQAHNIFMALLTPYQIEIQDTTRKNFFCYEYTVCRVFHMLGLLQTMPWYRLLGNSDKINEQDAIFKRICCRMNWEFIPFSEILDLLDRINTKYVNDHANMLPLPP